MAVMQGPDTPATTLVYRCRRLEVAARTDTLALSTLGSASERLDRVEVTQLRDVIQTWLDRTED